MKYLASSLGAAALGTLLIGSVAFAETQQPPQGQAWGRGPGMHGMMGHGGRGIMGQVTAESGTSLTVVSRGFGPNAATTTYAVDASNATVDKAGATIALSDVAMGDSVMIEGSISGTNVAATKIHDGLPPRDMGSRGWDKDNASSTPRGMGMMPPAIQGNGQPLVGGTVSAVSGSTITITNNNGGSTYSIDASSAKITKAGAAIALTQVAVGDAVLAQGTVNGTNIVATTVIDQGARPVSTGSTSGGTAAPAQAPHGMGGFFGGVGGFFRGLFGF